MNLQELQDTLALPTEARHDGRIPKKVVVEQAKPKAHEQALLERHVDEIRWAANLKPATVARAACTTTAPGEPAVSELQVLLLELRSDISDAERRKLAWLLHRGIEHYPVLLVTRRLDGAVHFSTRQLGSSSREAALRETEAIGITSDETASRFVRSLSIERQPFADLRALYEGWHGRIVALHVARELSAPYRSPSPTAARAWALAMDQLLALRRSRVQLLREIARERQPGRALQLSAERTRLDHQLQRLVETLHEDPSPPSLHP